MIHDAKNYANIRKNTTKQTCEKIGKHRRYVGKSTSMKINDEVACWLLAKRTSHIGNKRLPIKNTTKTPRYDHDTTRTSFTIYKKNTTTEIVQMFIYTIATKHEVCNSALTETQAQNYWRFSKTITCN